MASETVLVPWHNHFLTQHPSSRLNDGWEQSGYEPAHAGFVGKCMLTAAVCGNIFVSPNVIQDFDSKATSPKFVIVRSSPSQKHSNIGVLPTGDWENAKVDQVVTQLGKSESQVPNVAAFRTFGPPLNFEWSSSGDEKRGGKGSCYESYDPLRAAPGILCG
ncbi:hypothetical protein FIBSPDRAFT_926423 [Athelia psychrophila]|uniref:DhaK domain-containing protein n=1 Tax=Athelia psychrophila TaxID=1759441 RepID=A0A166TG64_9AGAM|nr:hypothetical protein FIBSPDRAFT_926423 [Fibularhizoctonia sp. CBS 109695]